MPIHPTAVIDRHAQIDSSAEIGPFVNVEGHVRIGPYVTVGGGTRLGKDVPPFFMAVGESECMGYNSIGLRRSGKFSNPEIAEVKEAYRTLYRSGQLFSAAVESLAGKVQTNTG